MVLQNGGSFPFFLWYIFVFLKVIRHVKPLILDIMLKMDPTASLYTSIYWLPDITWIMSGGLEVDMTIIIGTTIIWGKCSSIHSMSWDIQWFTLECIVCTYLSLLNHIKDSRAIHHMSFCCCWLYATEDYHPHAVPDAPDSLYVYVTQPHKFVGLLGWAGFLLVYAYPNCWS